MRKAHKYLALGLGLALGLAAVGTASASLGGGSKNRPYQRYIDAGNTGSAITVGKHTWETQSGFTGGTVGRLDTLLSMGALDPDVAQTVLTGPSAFSASVPAGRYQVSLWVARPAKGDVTIVAEGTAKQTVPVAASTPSAGTWLRTVALPVQVTDGILSLSFQPSVNSLQIAAVAIEGNATGPVVDPTPTPTPTPTKTTTPTPSPTTTRPTPPPTTPPTTTRTTPPVTTTTTSSPPSRSCANPVFVTSDTNGGWSNGGYYVHNNMWNAGEGGPETLYACAYNNWYVTSTQPNTTSVKTYPNVHKDYNNARISSFNSLTSTFAATSPHTGIYNVAYDIWTNGVASNGSTEFMIWTENYKQVPAGSVAATVTLSGKTYDVWKTGNNSYIAFVPKTPMTSGSLNLLEIFNWTISKGWLPATSTVGQIDYGVEICSTENKPATFNFTDFSISES